jgi:hypothetical protein
MAHKLDHATTLLLFLSHLFLKHCTANAPLPSSLPTSLRSSFLLSDATSSYIHDTVIRLLVANGGEMMFLDFVRHFHVTMLLLCLNGLRSSYRQELKKHTVALCRSRRDENDRVIVMLKNMP